MTAISHTAAPATDPLADARAFRAALGSFATGVTVITARAADGRPVGLTASSFNSVSLEPPMVLWSLAKKALSLPAFMQAGHWAVHVLAADQEALSNRFARAGEDKFAGLRIDAGVGGVPLLPGCAARFECETSFRYEGGDHIIFVGRVLSFQRAERAPLVFHGGRYAQAAVKPPLPCRQAGGFSEDLLGYLLGRAYHQFHLGIRPALRAAGLSDAAWYAVAALTVRDGLALEVLRAAIHHGDDDTLDQVLAPLQATGWVELRGSGAALRVHLSDSGRTRALHLLAAAKSREVDLLGVLGCAEGEMLKGLLQRLIAASDPGLPDLWAEPAAQPVVTPRDNARPE